VSWSITGDRGVVRGVNLYQIQSGGRQTGRWATLPGPGLMQTETLTFLKKLDEEERLLPRLKVRPRSVLLRSRPVRRESRLGQESRFAENRGRLVKHDHQRSAGTRYPNIAEQAYPTFCIDDGFNRLDHSTPPKLLQRRPNPFQ
jgi:hypothetical protein